ncbi:DNA starvation/stationary phase protection protein [Candidatus Dependentiae bacterium Noda2021]|nr:DNA starvation/stationary phase protection protein [Candidatus Dependentiae bacterium Noda2021]
MNTCLSITCIALLFCVPLETQQPLVNQSLAPHATQSINIGISHTNRKQVAQLLNSLLSDEFILYTQTLNYHWNVIDPYFSAMHSFFKEQYEQLFNFVDRIAERVRALDEFAAGSFAEFESLSALKTPSQGRLSTQDMLRNLLDNHESIIRTIRVAVETTQNDFKDAGTSNFLAEILVEHEKMAWMIRSSLTTK